MTDLSSVGRYVRMSRFQRNTRAFMQRHRVRCPETHHTWPTTLRCFGWLYHRGEHVF